MQPQPAGGFFARTATSLAVSRGLIPPPPSPTTPNFVVEGARAVDDWINNVENAASVGLTLVANVPPSNDRQRDQLLRQFPDSDPLRCDDIYRALEVTGFERTPGGAAPGEQGAISVVRQRFEAGDRFGYYCYFASRAPTAAAGGAAPEVVGPQCPMSPPGFPYRVPTSNAERAVYVGPPYVTLVESLRRQSAGVVRRLVARGASATLPPALDQIARDEAAQAQSRAGTQEGETLAAALREAGSSDAAALLRGLADARRRLFACLLLGVEPSAEFQREVVASRVGERSAALNAKTESDQRFAVLVAPNVASLAGLAQRPSFPEYAFALQNVAGDGACMWRSLATTLWYHVARRVPGQGAALQQNYAVGSTRNTMVINALTIWLKFYAYVAGATPIPGADISFEGGIRNVANVRAVTRLDEFLVPDPAHPDPARMLARARGQDADAPGVFFVPSLGVVVRYLLWVYEATGAKSGAGVCDWRPTGPQSVRAYLDVVLQAPGLGPMLAPPFDAAPFRPTPAPPTKNVIVYDIDSDQYVDRPYAAALYSAVSDWPGYVALLRNPQGYGGYTEVNLLSGMLRDVPPALVGTEQMRTAVIYYPFSTDPSDPNRAMLTLGPLWRGTNDLRAERGLPALDTKKQIAVFLVSPIHDSHYMAMIPINVAVPGSAAPVPYLPPRTDDELATMAFLGSPRAWPIPPITGCAPPTTPTPLSPLLSAPPSPLPALAPPSPLFVAPPSPLPAVAPPSPLPAVAPPSPLPRPPPPAARPVTKAAPPVAAPPPGLPKAPPARYAVRRPPLPTPLPVSALPPRPPAAPYVPRPFQGGAPPPPPQRRRVPITTRPRVQPSPYALTALREFLINEAVMSSIEPEDAVLLLTEPAIAAQWFGQYAPSIGLSAGDASAAWQALATEAGPL